MPYSRREFTQIALGALPAASLLGRTAALGRQTPAKPDSKWAGVHVGLNVPYSLGIGSVQHNMPADETLARCVELGISAVELRSQPIEAVIGCPAGLVDRAAAAITATSTPARVAAQKAALAELSEWRRSASMVKAREVGQQWNTAGVSIEILKFDGIAALPADVVDYCFTLAETVGARTLSCEISDDTRRLGSFADKHRMLIGYHGHEKVTPAIWEAAFAQAKFNGANLDLGHFVAGNNASPLPFLTQHHDRITHVHVKDRKLNLGPNVPFGQGDTPIKEALQLIRDNKWNIQATIEFEYPVPAGSDRMAELAKCVSYCKSALLS